MRDTLLGAIRSEGFPDGRLPPEADLALQLGVSRTTVRAALQSLADDGIVSRRRRHGTMINQHLLRSSMPLNRLVSFRALIEQSGHVPSVDPQVHAPRRADEAVAEALGVAQGTECLLVRRLLRAGDDPVIHITDTVPLGGLPALAEIVEADSTFAFLAANGAGVVEYVHAEVVPRVADAHGPSDLDIARGAPYIELCETLFTRDHRRIAFSRIAVDDSKVRFSLLRRQV